MNSIPLIKGNTPQEINTSIIALKKALSELEAQDRLLQGTDKDVQDKIKQINELIEGINTHLGTVDTHLTTIDGQITALQPVDTVTSGNMHSVTSGAVADSLSVKLPVLLFNVSNNSGSIKYYKVNDIFPSNVGEVVYFMQARAGELIVISAGHGDGDAYATPKAKRLLDTYSKILGLRYNGSVLYFSLSIYSHEVVFTKMSGTWDLTRSSTPVQEVSASEYNAAKAITIET